MTDDVRLLALDFIEAVKASDETRVREILTLETAGQVACEVAVIAAHAMRSAAQADERSRKAVRIAERFNTVAAANRQLVRERADLKQRLNEYRAGKPRKVKVIA